MTPFDHSLTSGLGGDLLGAPAGMPFKGLGAALMPSSMPPWMVNTMDGAGASSPRLTEENVDMLGRVLTKECGTACNPDEVQGIGSTLINRMDRDGTDQVADVVGHGAYAIADKADPAMSSIAMKLLSGDLGDNTGGATHFYSPGAMHKVGQPTGTQDIGGGVEQMLGPTAKAKGLAHSLPQDWNYVPSFAGGFKQYPRFPVPSTRDPIVKFYRQPGIGRVY